MRILRDMKIPNFKFPKFKMDGLKNLENMNVDYEEVKKKQEKKNSKEYEITDYKTVKEFFQRSTTKYADNTFILEKFNSKEPFKEIKYKEYRSDVISLGTALNDYLHIKDSRVVIIGENTYHWYISYMALLCGSGLAVPVDKELPENEIVNVINRSKATAVIFSPKKKELIKKVMESKQTDIKYFIEMYSDEELKKNTVGLNYLIKQGNILINNGNNSYMDIEIDPEEFKVLLFTSGTTSKAKGVMLCNRNLAENINAVSAYVKLGTNDRLLSILPLHHTYESTIGYLLPLANGASISVCQGLRHIVPDLKETKPTALLTVPLLVENLYKKINENIKKSKKDGLVNSMIHITNGLKNVGIDVKRKVFNEIYENLGGNIRIIVSAAAPIDAKIGKWVEDIGITFLQGYGLTETAPIAALTPEFKTKVGSAGKPVICADIKIDNPNEKGEGEILIKSETLMLGYYEDEEATKEAIIDGYFHSGDIGYLDDEGFLFITGRCKNVIVTQNGKNIYPEEIELMLGNIPEIKESMVYGKQEEEKKNDKELIITARVIPNYEEIEKTHGKNLTDEQIREIIWNKIKEVNRKLTSYKAIKKLEIKQDEFEKTTTMKIKRFAEIQNNNVK